MIELGQLEARLADFEKRNLRIVAASVDNVEDTKRTQEKFPRLTILSDAEKSLAQAASLLGAHRSPLNNEPVYDPLTVFVDAKGIVRDIAKSDRYIERLSPDEVLAKADAAFATK